MAFAVPTVRICVKNIFACLLSIHNTISLSRHEQDNVINLLCYCSDLIVFLRDFDNLRHNVLLIKIHSLVLSTRDISWNKLYLQDRKTIYLIT